MIEYVKAERGPEETRGERETTLAGAALVETEREDDVEVIRRASVAGSEIGGHIRNLVSMYQEAGRQLAEMGRVLQETRREMAAMAETLRVSNERMAAMEQAVRTLEKVTPKQAAQINRLIRDRAGEICEEYRMGVTVTPVEKGRGSVPERAEFRANEEKRAAVAAAIRKDLREMTGVRTAREICRCDWDAVREFVGEWEDFDRIQRIRKGAERRGKAGTEEKGK